MRLILADGRVNEWQPGEQGSIVASACNSRQVVVAMGQGRVAYFKESHGELTEYKERLTMTSEVLCLCLPLVPEGRQHAPFMVEFLHSFMDLA